MYFDGLVWDEIPRINKMLHTYFGADDTNANNFIGPAFLIAAVRRIYRAPVKFDSIMVLEGEQGKLTSTALKALCHDPSWFTDSSGPDLSNKRQAHCRDRGAGRY